MHTLLNMLHHGDVCSTVALIVVLALLGGKMVESHPTLRTWGVRAATAALLLYCVYACLTFAPATADAFLWITIRGLAAAGLVLGPVWIALTVTKFGYTHTVVVLLEKLQTWRHLAGMRAKERADRRAAEERRQREQQQYQLSATEREGLRQEAEARAKAEAEAKKRKEDLRLQCQFFFNLHEADIGNRFKREFFDDYLARYLGNDRPLEEAEERANHLLDQLRQALETANPKPVVNRFDTLEGIDEWFHAERAKVEAMPDDPTGRQKQTARALLMAQRAQLIQRYFERI